mmetsp:Transcript_77697/g.180224  ORF Transcript_77697/g.180224 Transcript_77697/m.180224 type:complete len:571 (-) Transcript_77697:89-1801(-)
MSFGNACWNAPWAVDSQSGPGGASAGHGAIGQFGAVSGTSGPGFGAAQGGFGQGPVPSYGGVCSADTARSNPSSGSLPSHSLDAVSCFPEGSGTGQASVATAVPGVTVGGPAASARIAASPQLPGRGEVIECFDDDEEHAALLQVGRNLSSSGGSAALPMGHPGGQLGGCAAPAPGPCHSGGRQFGACAPPEPCRSGGQPCGQLGSQLGGQPGRQLGGCGGGPYTSPAFENSRAVEAGGGLFGGGFIGGASHGNLGQLYGLEQPAPGVMQANAFGCASGPYGNNPPFHGSPGVNSPLGSPQPAAANPLFGGMAPPPWDVPAQPSGMPQQANAFPGAGHTFSSLPTCQGPPGGADPGQGAGPGPGPPCLCGQPSVALTVRKEGPNTGRIFYKCPMPQGEQCSYFQWADEMPPQPGPPCQCGVPSRQRKVLKEGPNTGRFFFVCVQRKCEFFQWADEDPTPQGRSRCPPVATPARSGAPFSRGTADRGNDVCYKCNGTGHWAQDCPNEGAFGDAAGGGRKRGRGAAAGGRGGGRGRGRGRRGRGQAAAEDGSDFEDSFAGFGDGSGGRFTPY